MLFLSFKKYLKFKREKLFTLYPGGDGPLGWVGLLNADWAASASFESDWTKK